MPYKVYTTTDGTQIHKLERAPPGSQAAGKPIVSNTKMSLEAVFDKTKARPLKALMAESKAKKAAAKKPKEPTDGYVVSHKIVDELTDMIHRELTSGAWHMTEIPEEERQDYVDENFNELVTELGGGYGVFDEVIEELEERLGYSPKTMMLGMKYLRDDAGYTMFDDYIEKHSG
jgi:hypothetical protein